MDLADGHLAALDHLHGREAGLLTLNLGSGQGHTVRQAVSAYEQASGRTIPIRVVARREGDAARSVAAQADVPRQLALAVPEPEGLLAGALHGLPL